MKKYSTILQEAYDLRQSIIKQDNLEAFRLYDRENDKLTEVAIDKYRDWAEIQVFAPLPENKLKFVVDDLTNSLNIKGVYIKDRTKEQCFKTKSNFLCGTRHPQHFIFEESGFKFSVNLEEYLDTGVFLDARIIRRIIKKNSQNKRVLNLFSYTGVSSLASISAGASQTISVDVSNTYSEWAKRNMELNGYDIENNRIIIQDVRDFLNSEKGRQNKYDLIIIDPPTFSHSKKGDFSVQRDHVRLLNDCLLCLELNGKILFTTHFKDFRFQKEKVRAKIKEITNETVPPEYIKGKVHRAFVISDSSKWEKTQERKRYNVNKKMYRRENRKRKRI